ncbi:DUF6708 domain-containing protein [Dyella sp. ASV21]|uniref:DUF6708 domain-containing protein n=1 Tax=Dyella sp. ASV21 TaxID=2795114 RepID=UPI0018EDB5B5|nr:DUF6708 domain-containing protein [Dyella sp. ASV21]
MAFLSYWGTKLVFGNDRGAYIRLPRGTRKLYYVPPRKKTLHTLDWDQVEGLAGYIPILSANGYASRHPLYLIGVDHTQTPPREICMACGNLGLFDGDRSARALWAYLQRFMADGPEHLPAPALPAPRLSRWQSATQPQRDWAAGLRHKLSTPRGKLLSPLPVPLWLGWWMLNAFTESVEQWLHVPYAAFPPEIDALYGMDSRPAADGQRA